jgi:hypothetical protein
MLVTADGGLGMTADPPGSESAEAPTAFVATTLAVTVSVEARRKGAAVKTLYGIVHVTALASADWSQVESVW